MMAQWFINWMFAVTLLGLCVGVTLPFVGYWKQGLAMLLAFSLPFAWLVGKITP